MQKNQIGKENLVIFFISGSSGSMEVEAAKVIWKRSVERYKLRYTTIVSDGDAKTFSQLTQLNPYGDGHPIKKEDCVNHVSKRLGTALRNVVTDCRKRGVTLGGRGRGQLTGVAIKRLTGYYSKAVRGKSSVEAMKKAVMASLYHCMSTDKKPQHNFCPIGIDSWCFFRRAKAKKEKPGPHDKCIHTPLNEERLN